MKSYTEIRRFVCSTICGIMPVEGRQQPSHKIPVPKLLLYTFLYLDACMQHYLRDWVKLLPILIRTKSRKLYTETTLKQLKKRRKINGKKDRKRRLLNKVQAAPLSSSL